MTPRWQIDPAEQRARDEAALQLLRSEQEQNPGDAALRRDIANRERKLGMTGSIQYGAADEVLFDASDEDEILDEGTQVPMSPSAIERAAAGAAPERTLADRQGERNALEKKVRALRRQFQDALGADAYHAVDDPERAFRAWAKGKGHDIDEMEARAEQLGVGSMGRDIGAALGGAAGSIGGGLVGAAGGPVGIGAGILGGGAAGSAAGSAIGTWLDTKMAKDTITADEAKALMAANALEDAVLDAAGNLLFFAGGKALKVIASPQLRTMLQRAAVDKLGAKRADLAAKLKDKAVQRATTGNLVGETREQALKEASDLDYAEAAVKELAARSGGYVPTKGQITGRSSTGERIVRGFHPELYRKQQAGLESGAQAMREEFLGTPLSRSDVGRAVQNVAQQYRNKVQNRTRPVFEAANQAEVAVDFSPVAARIEAALATDEAAVGVHLHPGERSSLQRILKGLSPAEEADDAAAALVLPEALMAERAAAQEAAPLQRTAEGALNFVSGLKGTLRATATDGPPSGPYRKLVGELVGTADKAFEDAVVESGNAKLRRDLLAAREDYRKMMGTVFDDDAVQAALGKNPEDVGRLFWQRGSVTEVDELDKLLKQARSEGAIDAAGEKELRERMLLGFLRDAVPDAQAAAKWSEKLAADDARRETFSRLSQLAGSKELIDGMRVLEQAAKMSSRGNALLAQDMGMAANAVSRGVVGLALGYVSPQVGLTLMAADRMSAMMAQALASGNRGIYRDLLMVLRADANREVMQTAPVRKAAERVIKWAKENRFTQKDQPDEETQQ